MGLRTKQQIVDEIVYEVYSGIPTNDRTISDAFVVRKLNNRIAEAAIKSAFGAYNLDGCVCVDDIFTLTYSNITLLTDTVTKNKYFTLPAQPIGLPSKRSMAIFPPANRGGVMSSIFKPIMRGEVSKVRDLPSIKKVFHYTEDGNEYFIDSFQIMATYDTVNLSITTAGANDLTAFLNLPDDMIAGIKSLIIPELKQMITLQDTTPLPPADRDQPRGGI